MNYFDTKGRLKVDQERRIAERRTQKIPDMQQSIARVRAINKVDQPKSLRDEFAMAVMPALVALYECGDSAKSMGEITSLAYTYADSAMEAREDGEHG